MKDIYDKRAVKILCDTYWTSKGWQNNPTVSPQDKKYAMEHHLMFDPKPFEHDGTLLAISKMCDQISPAAVGASFLASISSRQPYMRSPMGSYAIARARPPHTPTPNTNGIYCRYCSLPIRADAVGAEDLNILSFERFKWGGVRHGQATYQWFDLHRFLVEGSQTPNSDDIQLFRATLKIIATLPPDATAGAYAKAIGSAFPSNLNERTQFIEILAYAGLLAYPGFRDVYDDTVPPADRPYRDTDWTIPAMYWRSRDGVNAKRLREYFPEWADELLRP